MDGIIIDRCKDRASLPVLDWLAISVPDISLYKDGIVFMALRGFRVDDHGTSSKRQAH